MAKKKFTRHTFYQDYLFEHVKEWRRQGGQRMTAVQLAAMFGLPNNYNFRFRLRQLVDNGFLNCASEVVKNPTSGGHRELYFWIDEETGVWPSGG